MQPAPSNRNSLNLVIAIIAGVTWALFWAVDKTLAYVLFGTTSFFLVLYIYNRMLSTRSVTASFDRPQQRRESYRTPESTATGGKMLMRLMAFTAAAGIGLAVLYRVTASSSAGMIDTQTAFSEAERFYSLGTYDSAYYYYKYTVAQDENMSEAWLGLGNTLYMQSERDSALYMYQRALTVNPDYRQAQYNIAWWYYDQKQFSESLVRAKEMVVADPYYADGLQLTADSFYATSQYDSAITWYEQAYANGARSRWVCHVMAYLYDRDNQTALAIPLYQEALQYDSSIVDIYKRLGELLPGREGNVYRSKAAELSRN